MMSTTKKKKKKCKSGPGLHLPLSSGTMIQKNTLKIHASPK